MTQTSYGEKTGPKSMLSKIYFGHFFHFVVEMTSSYSKVLLFKN